LNWMMGLSIERSIAPVAILVRHGPRTRGGRRDAMIEARSRAHEGGSPMRHRTCILLAVTALTACARNEPIVYQSGQAAGSAAAAEAAIAACKQAAEAAGASPHGGAVSDAARRTVGGAAVGGATGAVGGAIAGNAGKGAAIGAATGAAANVLRRFFDEPAPNPAYRAFVERCLRDRGIEIVGWQ